MAWRIADNVVRGELDNRTPGLVQGKIWLAGSETPLALKLSGNGHKDLAGCRLTFSNPVPKADPNLTLKPDQTGAVGGITAPRGKVRLSATFAPGFPTKNNHFPSIPPMRSIWNGSVTPMAASLLSRPTTRLRLANRPGDSHPKTKPGNSKPTPMRCSHLCIG